MAYTLLTDDEIVHDLGKKLDMLRRTKEVPISELLEKSGTNHNTYDRFINAKSGISLKNFIRLLRGIGALDKLEILLDVSQSYSPLQEQTTPKKRIRKKPVSNAAFTWGEDQ